MIQAKQKGQKKTQEEESERKKNKKKQQRQQQQKQNHNKEKETQKKNYQTILSIEGGRVGKRRNQRAAYPRQREMEQRWKRCLVVSAEEIPRRWLVSLATPSLTREGLVKLL